MFFGFWLPRVNASNVLEYLEPWMCHGACVPRLNHHR